MIQQRLQEWILHPETLNEESLYELRSILQRYPYFQTARLLYLKNLFLLHDAGFKEELKKNTLYVADLSALFYYIEGTHFMIEKHEMLLEEPTLSDIDRTQMLIDRFLADSSDEQMASLPLALEPNTDYASTWLTDKQDDSSEQVNPLKGQDLIDSFIENSKSGQTAVKSAEDLLMDDLSGEEEDTAEECFLPKEEPEASACSGGEEEGDESYFTETLAKIYVKQHRYDKALEIIKKLYLKYPKKNVYFADQIRFLEKLIINAKSK